MTVRPQVLAAFSAVAAQQKQTLPPLHDELPLLECGLDSLGFALVVARLEDELGVDPFSAAADEIVFPVTLGDFVALYDRAHAAA